MGTPSTIRVDDDLTAGETSITVRSANDEASRRIEDNLGLGVHKIGWHNLVNNLLLEVFTDVLVSDRLIVLGRDEDGVDAFWDHLSLLALDILDDNLGLPVRTDPFEGSVLADVGETLTELSGEHVCEGHEGLLILVSGVAEHVALVTGTDLILLLVDVDTLGNIRRLLFDSNKNSAGPVVEALLLVVVADLLEGLTHDFFVVHSGLGSDLSEDHDHAGLGAGFARNLRVLVPGEASVENGIGDLVAELIGVSFVDGFRGEEEAEFFAVRHCRRRQVGA
mmetsp:Transcript_16081/g.30518  ORF Transcript_16081/g.30518 Transcript_16081/m.30518 type:complete len:279 (-) Transcript_16081:29-865(-)